jgi:predicted transcriptional regulator
MTHSAPSLITSQSDRDDQVTAIAARLDRPKAWIVDQALRDCIAVHDWQAAAIDPRTSVLIAYQAQTDLVEGLPVLHGAKR